MNERVRREESGAQLFTASDIARFCQVDLKTIHNWSEKGEIRHFRTPGRHLRFRRLDVLDFLRKYGYPIPQALRQGKPKVVVIDEDPDALAPLRRSLGRRFEVSAFVDPFEGLVSLAATQPDALIVDVTMTAMDGVKLLTRLRAIALTAHIRTIAYATLDAKRRAALEAAGLEFIAKGSIAQLRESLEQLTGLEKAE